MRKATIATAALLAGALALGGAAPRPDDPAKGRNKLEGTWEQASADFDPNLRQVKIINATHYVWVTYERESKRAIATAGGPYTLVGDKYTETLEFARFGIPELQENVGKAQTFTITIDGDRLHQSGTLANGYKIEEDWKRVK